MASVLKRGGVWYAKWTDAAGKRRREPTQATRKTEAKALADELEVEARRRHNLMRRARNGLPPRPEDLTGTLAELCTWWLEHRCPEASKSSERLRLGKHVLSTPIGALPLSAIGSPQIDELLHTTESAGVSAASVNKLRSVLHTVFSKAKKAGKWVGENPVASTERRKVAKRVYATLRGEEVPLLLAEVPAEWRPLFAAALWTGMRRGELFALRKSDIDFTLGTIMVARSNARDTTKGGHADLIPIAAPLFPILRHQLKHAPGSLVFPAADGSQRSPEADPQKVLRTALARAGRKRFRARCVSTICGTRRRRFCCARASMLIAFSASCDTATCARRPRSTATWTWKICARRSKSCRSWLQIGSKPLKAKANRSPTHRPTPQSPDMIRGGRCRIRTCDPCRVKAQKGVSTPYANLASSRNHDGPTAAYNGTDEQVLARFGRGLTAFLLHEP